MAQNSKKRRLIKLTVFNSGGANALLFDDAIASIEECDHPEFNLCCVKVVQNSGAFLYVDEQLVFFEKIYSKELKREGDYEQALYPENDSGDWEE